MNAPLRQRRHERGVALITALLVVAVIAIVATQMTARQSLDVRRTANVLNGDRAYVFALGVESWASHMLARDKRDSSNDHPEETWATQLPPISVEGAVVGGRIEDLQGRFNLNNLIKGNEPSALDVERYRRLLETLGLDPGLAEALVDWIDADQETRFPGGAEDAEYMRADIPRRAANRLLTSASELLLMQGYTREVYTALAPYVVALPERTDINVNTASIPVLRCIAAGVTEADAKALIDARGKQGFANINDFVQHDALAGRDRQVAGLGIASRYFLLQAQTQFGKRTLTLYSVLARNDQGAVKTLMRGQGAI